MSRYVCPARLLEGRGIVLTASGDLLVGLCHFHAGTQPTFTVNPSANT